MCNLDDVKRIVQEENRNLFEKNRKQSLVNRRWFIGFAGPFIVCAVWALMENHFSLESHTQDGHPATVKVVVGEIKNSLTEIQTTQRFIREDLQQVKKNLMEKNYE